MRSLFIISLLWAYPVAAQSIEVGELDSAAPFQAGSLTPETGALDQLLWQGTSAGLATDILEDFPDLKSDIAKTLLRAALLSPGIPPATDDPGTAQNFQNARIAAILQLGDLQSVQSLISQMPSLANDPHIGSDLAFRSGDAETACTIVDGVFENRGKAEWLRKRALCHVVRDEIPAAELTTDLLRESGYEDPFYYSQMRRFSGAPGKPGVKGLKDDAVHTALMTASGTDWPKGKTPILIEAQTALSEDATGPQRLSALYAGAPALSDAQMTQILESLGRSDTGLDQLTGTLVDVETARNADPHIGLGQLFDIARFGNSPERGLAAGEILKRADAANAFARFADLLAPNLSSLTTDEQIGPMQALFIRAAITRRDFSALQSFHQELTDIDPELRNRLALASDAIGNGFYGGSAGFDIDERLGASGAKKKRAVRDAIIAFSLGANLSDDAATALSQGSGIRVRMPADVLALRAAARKQARGETALRSARILKDGTDSVDDLVLAEVISALQTAGLFDLAGQVAARDFLSGAR